MVALDLAYLACRNSVLVRALGSLGYLGAEVCANGGEDSQTSSKESEETKAPPLGPPAQTTQTTETAAAAAKLCHQRQQQLQTM